MGSWLFYEPQPAAGNIGRRERGGGHVTPLLHASRLNTGQMQLFAVFSLPQFAHVGLSVTGHGGALGVRRPRRGPTTAAYECPVPLGVSGRRGGV